MDSPQHDPRGGKKFTCARRVSLQLHNLADDFTPNFSCGVETVDSHSGGVCASLNVPRKCEDDGPYPAGNLKTIWRKMFALSIFATGVTYPDLPAGWSTEQLRSVPKAEIRVTVGVTEEMVAGLLDRRFDWRSSRSPFGGQP